MVTNQSPQSFVVVNQLANLAALLATYINCDIKAVTDILHISIDSPFSPLVYPLSIQDQQVYVESGSPFGH